MTAASVGAAARAAELPMSSPTANAPASGGGAARFAEDRIPHRLWMNLWMTVCRLGTRVDEPLRVLGTTRRSTTCTYPIHNAVDRRTCADQCRRRFSTLSTRAMTTMRLEIRSSCRRQATAAHLWTSRSAPRELAQVSVLHGRMRMANDEEDAA